MSRSRNYPIFLKIETYKTASEMESLSDDELEELLKSERNISRAFELLPGRTMYDQNGRAFLLNFFGPTLREKRLIFPHEVIKNKPQIELKNIKNMSGTALAKTIMEAVAQNQKLNPDIISAFLSTQLYRFEHKSSEKLTSFGMELYRVDNDGFPTYKLDTLADIKLADIELQQTTAQTETAPDADYELSVLIALMIAKRVSFTSSEYYTHRQSLAKKLISALSRYNPYGMITETIVLAMIPYVENSNNVTRLYCALCHFFTICPTHKLIGISPIVITSRNKGHTGREAVLWLEKLVGPDLVFSWAITPELKKDFKNLFTQDDELGIPHSYTSFMMDYQYTNVSPFSSKSNPAITFLVYALECHSNNTDYYKRVVETTVNSEQLLKVSIMINEALGRGFAVPRTNQSLKTYKDSLSQPSSLDGMEWFMWYEKGGRFSKDKMEKYLDRWAKIPNDVRTRTIGHFLRSKA